MTRIRKVSQDKWRNAVKFVSGLEVNPSLSPAERKFLQKHVGGRHTPEDAARLLRQIGWRTQ